MDAATEAKTTVENAQRELRATGVQHTTRFFELRDNRWVPRIQYVWEPPPLAFIGFLVNSFITLTGSRKTHKKPLRQYKHGYGPARPKKAAIAHRVPEH
jgi:hypothetical protein